MARFFSATGEQGGNRLSSHFKHVSVIRDNITVRAIGPMLNPQLGMTAQRLFLDWPLTLDYSGLVRPTRSKNPPA